MNNTNVHGGDLDLISRLYNIDKSKIINFSGNVNPLGLPQSVKDAIRNNVSICTDYPDVDYIALRSAIAKYINTSIDNITIGNGSTELISGFIKYTHPKDVVIISPAYSEYLKEVNSVGGTAHLYELKEDNNFKIDIDNIINNLNKSIDLLVMCNPNNPTGSYVTTTELEKLLSYCKNNNIKVMIDETYVEFADKNISISAIELTNKFDNLFVIRGTSKFFACPGLRLGYGVCSNSYILDYINSHKDLWSVNVFADLAGKTMFLDTKFITDTINLITSERKRIIDEINSIEGLKLFDTQSNFFLVKIEKDDINSDYIFNELIKEGILIRNCKDFPFLNDKFIRFCILDKEHNTILLNKLKNLIQ